MWHRLVPTHTRSARCAHCQHAPDIPLRARARAPRAGGRERVAPLALLRLSTWNGYAIVALVFFSPSGASLTALCARFCHCMRMPAYGTCTSVTNEELSHTRAGLTSQSPDRVHACVLHRVIETAGTVRTYLHVPEHVKWLANSGARCIIWHEEKGGTYIIAYERSKVHTDLVQAFPL